MAETIHRAMCPSCDHVWLPEVGDWSWSSAGVAEQVVNCPECTIPVKVRVEAVTTHRFQTKLSAFAPA